MLTRNPVTRVATYTGTLSSEGSISRLEVGWQTPEENPDGPGPEHWSITIEGDSATVERTVNGDSTTTRIEAPAGLIPQIGRTPWSYAIVEQAVKQAIASGSDSYPVQLMTGSRPQPSPTTITRPPCPEPPPLRPALNPRCHAPCGLIQKLSQLQMRHRRPLSGCQCVEPESGMLR